MRASCPNGHKEGRLLYESRDRMFHISGTFNVYRCTVCGVSYLADPPTPSEIGKYYPRDKYYSYHDQDDDGFFGALRGYLLTHYYHPTVVSRFIAAVVHNVPAIPSPKLNGRIFDIGCGTGGTLASLGKLGWQTYGSDLDRRAIQIARSKGVRHALVGGYEVLKRFPDNYFDAIRMYHVIEHLAEPLDCLAIIRKKLRPGGELIIGTPNAGSPAARLFGKYWYNLDTPRHLVLFSPRSLGETLKKTGFSVRKTEFCSAGGILGSLGYLLGEKTGRKTDFLAKQWLVLLFYPAEWLMDKLSSGDIFVVRAGVS
ncbi:class I SAM-dependent methyltransferase [Patescibacteria group bacterium]|nr:class I SAM-dependent methyltransferase [Patescibacteria group bacterium]